MKLDKYFQNYEMRIGNNTDWRLNPSCPDAPYATIAKDDSLSSGWVVDPFFWNYVNVEDSKVWRCGTERSCNLVGRYVSIVADYTEIAKPF